MGKIFVVGIGPGNRLDMTARAVAALEQSDIIAGYTVYVDLVRSQFPQKACLTTPMRQEADRCRAALEQAAGGQTVALVCSGDAGVYGMAGLVYELSDQYCVQVYNAAQQFCLRLHTDCDKRSVYRKRPAVL